MSQRDDFVAYLRWLVDVRHIRYDNPASESRCQPEMSGFADCSGFVVAGERHVGIGKACITSFGFAQEGHAAHTGMTLEEARWTRGALLIIGNNEGQGGSHGHIEVSLGLGNHNVGARNHAMGVGYFTIDSLPWSYCCRPVGMAGFDSVPAPHPVPKPVRGSLMTTVPAPGGGWVRPVPAFAAVVAEDGARLKGDKANGANRVWTSKDPQVLASNGGHPLLVDIFKRDDGGGIEALFDLGGGDVRGYQVEWG